MTSTRPEAPAQQPADSTSQRRSSRSLTPVEMAQAAVMAALSAALTILSVVVPFAGGLSLLVTVPMGLLGYRYRLRVLLAATFAASAIAFLIAGISGFMVVLNCAYVGGATGIIKRRGGGTPTMIAVSVVAGVVNGLWIIGILTVLVRLRTLTFEAMTANVDGVITAMSQFEPFRQAAQDTRAMFGTALEYWPVLIMSYSIFTI
ncbi:MAG: cobalt ABC transporter ATP-binding protein, partial [Mycobacterium sp.]